MPEAAPFHGIDAREPSHPRGDPMGRRMLSRMPYLVVAGCLIASAVGSRSEAAPSSDALWTGVSTSTAAGEAVPAAVFALDRNALGVVLDGAPREGRMSLDRSPAILSLPMPDGSLARFHIEESPVFEPELAALHPEIRSFRGQGMDLAGATVRLDWTPGGLHALILATGISVTVYPTDGHPEATYLS